VPLVYDNAKSQQPSLLKWRSSEILLECSISDSDGARSFGSQGDGVVSVSVIISVLFYKNFQDCDLNLILIRIIELIAGIINCNIG
jgi:hypothetical protein